MKKLIVNTIATFTALIALCASGNAHAHGGNGSVALHTGYDHKECYFDLHPELTKGQFRTFAAEAGQFLYFRPLASAETLGQWNFDVSLQANQIHLDDQKGAWNNTMSHPGEDHDLGAVQLIPQLTLRMGLTDDIDVETYFTKNPDSNFSFIGVASKVREMDEQDGAPVSVAVRPSLSGLVRLGQLLIDKWAQL